MKNIELIDPKEHRNLYRRLKKHVHHDPGVYVRLLRTGVIELVCWARTHGGRHVKILRIAPDPEPRAGRIEFKMRREGRKIVRERVYGDRQT